MKSTITDVARVAGVSMKTVSRVLNGEPNVSAKTKAKVEAAAKSLKYAPNIAARGLASSKSYLIALLYDIPSPGYVTNLQAGASRACREKGYHLVVEPTNMEQEDFAATVERMLRHLPVDGVIIPPPLCDVPEIIEILNELNTPYIPIGSSKEHKSTTIVKMDDFRAGSEMTQYLISLGHTKIGFIRGHAKHGAAAERYEGFIQVMQNAGLEINQDWIEDGAFTFQSGVEAGKKLLGQAQRPSAIFASNDDMAAGVISVAAGLGMNIPNDLSVCGFDDTPLASNIAPALTTIRQPVIHMGYKAAVMLLKRKADEPIMDFCLLDHELIIRESCAPYKI